MVNKNEHSFGSRLLLNFGLFWFAFSTACMPQASQQTIAPAPKVVTEEPAYLPQTIVPIPTDVPRLSRDIISRARFVVYNHNLELIEAPDDSVIGYRKKGGNPVFFDPAKLAEAKAKAIESSVPQLVGEVLIRIEPAEFVPTQEHPITKELPADVLRESELAARGINIIQTPSGAQLYIRSPAFDPEGPLNSYDGSGEKLTIVLVNGPVISPPYLQDPRYDNVRALVPETPLPDVAIDSYKRHLSILIAAALQTYLQIAAVSPNHQKHPSLQQYLNALTELRLVESLNEEEKETIGRYFASEGLFGAYFSPEDYKKKGGDGQTSVIFLAVGKGPNFKEVCFFVGPSGNVIVINQELITNMQPQPWMTHPDPEDFKREMPGDPRYPLGYRVGPQNDPNSGGKGFPPLAIFRHELNHYGQYLKAKNNNGKPVFYETLADLDALAAIAKAHSIWERSGYTDNRGFPFIFSLPDGGYIFGKN